MTGATPTGEELAEYRARARDWLATASIPELPDDYDQRARALRDWHGVLYEAGWVGIQWPAEVGGQGLSAHHQLAFSDELARARAPQPAGAIGLEVVGPTLLKYGTDAQRERFVRPLLSGEHVWCQCFSEPEAGSDLGSLRTRGVVTDDNITITGHKIWTSWATDADWCAVLVRTDPDAPKHRGISYVLVDLRSPGVTVRPIVMLNGDAEFNEVFFEDVVVPRENVLGELHGGWKLAMDTLGWERGGYAIRRRIENEIVFSNVVDGLREGGAVSEVEAERVGSVYLSLRAFRALSHRTAQRLVDGDVPSPHDSVDKLILATTEQDVMGLAFDLGGQRRLAAGSRPRGLSADSVFRSFLYGRAATVYGGSAQIQRTLIAERLLGMPRGR